ncbi:MAG: MmcQ/YjbR family DNA-binding protein [Acidimicrobiales bacterium]
MDRGGLEERIRAICLALPGATERRSHGAPAFFAGKQFLMLWLDGHHDHDFPHLWSAAPPGAQDELVSSEPDRFFRPPYVGSRGWVGLRLDQPVDWDELAALCEEAFRTVAPKKLVAALEAMRPSGQAAGA